MIISMFANNSEIDDAEQILDEAAGQKPEMEPEYGDENVEDMLNQPLTKNHKTIPELLDHFYDFADDFYKQLGREIARGYIPDTDQYEETNHYNVLFEGPTGAGKTSIVKQWARKNDLEVVTINMMGDALDFLGVKTIDKDYKLPLDDEGKKFMQMPRVSTVATKAFDMFLRGKDKILFIDELNKTNPGILQAIYDLISFHIVQNGDEVMFLPKLLFVVGAQNPESYGGRNTVDRALNARFTKIKVNYDTVGFAKYIQAQMDKFLAGVQRDIDDYKKQGLGLETREVQRAIRGVNRFTNGKEIAEKLFKKPEEFTWYDQGDSDHSDDQLVPRTLEGAFFNYDGTKESFLEWVYIKCGEEAYLQCAHLLGSFKAKNHPANEIFGPDYDPEKPKTPEKPEVPEDEKKPEENPDGEDDEPGEEESELRDNMLGDLNKWRSDRAARKAGKK